MRLELTRNNAFRQQLALLVVGIKFFPKIEGLGVNLWTDTSVAPGIAYMALSLSINTTLTISIIARLLFVRRQLGKAMGKDNPSQTYITAVAALIESAALYTVYALLAVIACGTNSPMQYVLLPALGQLQVCTRFSAQSDQTLIHEIYRLFRHYLLRVDLRTAVRGYTSLTGAPSRLLARHHRRGR